MFIANLSAHMACTEAVSSEFYHFVEKIIPYDQLLSRCPKNHFLSLLINISIPHNIDPDWIDRVFANSKFLADLIDDAFSFGQNFELSLSLLRNLSRFERLALTIVPFSYSFFTDIKWLKSKDVALCFLSVLK